MAEIKVTVNTAHPWGDRQKGFDVMEVLFDTELERDQAVKQAEKEFWRAWVCGHEMSPMDLNDSGTPKKGRPAAALYKPSGLNAPWTDSPQNPHPGCIAGIEISDDSDREPTRIDRQRFSL